MENNPFGSGPSPFEAPGAGAGKSDKDTEKEKSSSKTPSWTEKLREAADEKEKASRKGERSADKPSPVERKDDKAEAAPAKTEAAAEQIPSELSLEERHHIQRETARDHLDTIEHADEETAEQLEPAAEFLQKVVDGQDVEEAFAETAAEAGLSEEEVPELIHEAPDLGTEPESGEDIEAEAEAGVIDTSEDTEGIVGWRNSQAGATAARSGSGGRGMPPTTPPAQPMSPAGGASAPRSVPVAPPSPASLPPRVETYFVDRNAAADLLIGGFIGYLIGRRRGRIRTEKKLLPVQRKLEKQVKALQEDITYKERQLVQAKAEKRNMEQAAEVRPAGAAPAERTQPGRTETRLGMEKPARAERLGHIVVAVEAPRKTVERPQLTSEKTDSIRSSFRPEQVPDMSRNELLELSEKIIIEGASLRHIYESRLIGERQLRHLVSEYLQGKDIRKALRHEMIEREIDFERDPILRDRVRNHMAESKGNSGGLGEMLAKAGITTNETDPSFEHRLQKEAERREAQERKAHRQRVVADTALATAVVVLAVIVAILALQR